MLQDVIGKEVDLELVNILVPEGCSIVKQRNTMCLTTLQSIEKREQELIGLRTTLFPPGELESQRW